MDNIWMILELEPTQDVSAIRRAYARKARDCHPEEDEAGFLRLRQAYQAALDYAEGVVQGPEPVQEEVPEEEPQDEGWVLTGETAEDTANPYEDGEAIRSFLALYTGNQRRNPKLWMDYISSAAFLDAAWDSRFTALLLEKVTELEPTCPPNKEFSMWLSVVYQYTVEDKVEIDREVLQLKKHERHINFAPGAEFDGMESIVRLATTVSLFPKKPKGNEFAMLQSFRDYRHLVRLAEARRWDQEALDAYREVLGRYVSAYIRERCEQRVTPDCERHPAGLRVFLHFFQRDDLPESLYRDAWQKLDLKSAIMGRGKALYGPLRERVLEVVPDIDQAKPENFFQVNKNLEAHIARVKVDPEGEEAASAVFFASGEVQRALSSPRFIEKELLTYSPWRLEDIGEGLVRRILDFYRTHPDIPRASEAAVRMEEKLREQTVKRWNREDAQAVPGPLTLSDRPFFRYWLNTGFYTARDPESGTALLEYLEQSLPYQKEWSRRFAEETETTAVGEVEVDFFPLHMAFRVDGEEVYRPCLSWERTASEAGDRFFFLLPITAAPYGFFEDAVQEILRRLEDTAAPEEDRVLIARCLAGHVCCLPQGAALPLELCAEGGGRLYVCVWQEDGEVVTLFQQTASGRRVQRQYRTEWGECPLEAARWLLAEAVSPTRFDLSRLQELPWHIYYTPNGGSEKHLTQPDFFEHYEKENPPVGELNEEVLSSLLVHFGRDELERLEMEWVEGRLVLRRDGGKYACFYFEKLGDDCYVLLADAEIYRTVDYKAIKYLPFGMGKLAEYSVFDSAAALMRDMEEVMAQMGRRQLQMGGPGGWMWSCDVSRQNGKHKLMVAQQKLGGVPLQRSSNYLLAKFILSRYPVQLESVDRKGERTITAIRSGGYGQATGALIQFMQEKLDRLRLTWAFQTPEGGTYQRHLVLRQDEGRFMMFWLEDDQERALAYAAGSPVMFLGYAVLACLAHLDLKRIRNGLDLLLDDIDRTGPVVDRAGEFVPVSLPYRDIRALLVHEEE